MGHQARTSGSALEAMQMGHVDGLPPFALPGAHDPRPAALPPLQAGQIHGGPVGGVPHLLLRCRGDWEVNEPGGPAGAPVRLP